MSEQSFEREKICAVFVKMCTKRMSESMACKALRPPQPPLMCMDMTREEKSINGFIDTGLFGKKPPHGSAVFKPVACQQIKGCMRKNGIPILPCFRMADMDTEIFKVNIFTTEMADFPDA